MGDRLQEASEIDEPIIDELLSALQEAADAISENRISDAQEALERVAAALEAEGIVPGDPGTGARVVWLILASPAFRLH